MPLERSVRGSLTWDNITFNENIKIKKKVQLFPKLPPSARKEQLKPPHVINLSDPNLKLITMRHRNKQHLGSSRLAHVSHKLCCNDQLLKVIEYNHVDARVNEEIF